MFGFLLATSIFTFHNAWYLIVPLVVFLILLVLFKMVSLSSMCAAIASSLFITYMPVSYTHLDQTYPDTYSSVR